MSVRRGPWTVADVPGQNGQAAVVTGANSGIGFEVAAVLARHGADTVLACRVSAYSQSKLANLMFSYDCSGASPPRVRRRPPSPRIQVWPSPG